MANTVFLLGAGASASSGVPVMSGFLEQSFRLLKQNKVGTDVTEFELTQKGFNILRKILGDHLDTNNLESVYLAFEMAHLIHHFGDLDTVDEIQYLPSALRVVIGHTIDATMRFPIDGNMVLAPKDYAVLARYLKTLVESEYDNACVMTFNYDCGLDYALACENLTVNYELEPLGSADIDLLKLHGSLNWTEQGDNTLLDRAVTPLTIPDVDPLLRINSASTHLKFVPDQEDAFIVPPTASKSDLHQRIWPVWTTASHRLEEADNIIVCGYSLPDTDRFLHDLFSLAVVSGKRLKSMLVLDRTASPELRTRYRRLLPATMLDCLVVAPMTFEEAVNTLARSGLDGLVALAKQRHGP